MISVFSSQNIFTSVFFQSLLKTVNYEVYHWGFLGKRQKLRKRAKFTEAKIISVSKLAKIFRKVLQSVQAVDFGSSFVVLWVSSKSWRKFHHHYCYNSIEVHDNNLGINFKYFWIIEKSFRQKLFWFKILSIFHEFMFTKIWNSFE